MNRFGSQLEKTTFNAQRVSKLVAVVATAAGVLVSLATVLQTERRDAETRRLIARQPFLNRQLALYVEAVRVGAKLATGVTGSREVVEARQRFLELYYGELSLVEDRQVEAAMDKIKKNCLDREPECSPQTLGQLVLGLTEACRSSLAKSWGVSDWLANPSGPSTPSS